METERVRGNPPGITNTHVAANIRAARQAIGMDLRTMSDALGAAGRKLSPSGISKLENGDRRVDVDDLTVIAYLLRTSPAALLTPPDEQTTLTGVPESYLPEEVEAGIDYNAVYAGVSEVFLATFATVHSLALQQTLWEMGKAAIEAFPEIAEVKFAMPNKHHFVVDLSPFGLDNPNEVFYAADRPYGLIEGTIVRDGVTAEPDAWTDVPTFV